MVRIAFTANLQRHLDVPETRLDAATVRDALAQVFKAQPRLRSYLLDDQDRLRQHVAIFIDGQQIRDRLQLSDLVAPESEIYVVQALSGG